jgi:hypothetical protein
LGVGWIAHGLPFHRSANVTSMPALLVRIPTAVHTLAGRHATPDNALL